MKKREKKPKSKARRIIEWVGIGILGCIFTFALIAQIDAMVHKDENWGQQLRFGVGSFVVKTNSMEPEYKVGSAIITYKKNPAEIYEQWNADHNAHIDITFTYREFPSFIPDDKTLIKQTNEVPDRKIYGSPMTHRLREVHVDPSVEVGKGRYIFVVSGINPTEEWAADQYQAFSETYLLGVVVANSDFLGKVFSFIASPWGLFALLLIPAFYLVISSTADIFRILREPEEETSGGDGNKKQGTVSVIPDSERERLKQEMLMQMLEEKRKAKQAAKEENADAEKPANQEESVAESAPNEDASVTEQKEETAPKAEKNNALSGYDDAQKAELRKQMLAQIMAEKKAGKGKEEQAPKDEAPKAEKTDALADYDAVQKAELRKQMLAQILAEKKAAKGNEKPAAQEPAPEEKQEAKKNDDALAGYDDAQKAELRRQMLAQIMAEKKAAKAKVSEEKKEKDDGQA